MWVYHEPTTVPRTNYRNDNSGPHSFGKESKPVLHGITLAELGQKNDAEILRILNEMG